MDTQGEEPGKTATLPDKDGPRTSSVSPTIAIYQDPSYIEGILQQVRGGLITDFSQSDDSQNTRKSNSGTTGKGELGANLNVPGIGGVSAKAELTGTDGANLEDVFGRQETRNYKFTSAFYLHHVRKDLGAAGLLKTVDSNEDVSQLVVGDFIEFQASFKPDELISLMDVLNPGLVAELTRWMRRKNLIPQLVDEQGQPRQDMVLQYQTRPDADADIAKAVAEAVRVDFRSHATREYYGTITPGHSATAVVVCDTRSFLVEDADRILDGYFTVLGKVSTPPAHDVPVLERNKVLDRIRPEAVDWVTTELRNLAKRKIEEIDSPAAEEKTLEQFLDLNFPSRIDGISFKVIPVAIYL